MITIAKPKEQISVLWSKPEIDPNLQYRLMRYILRVDYKGFVLLQNIVTGQLVALEGKEVDILDSLPMNYCSVMKQLIDNHYLVNDQFDEHKQVLKMREVLRLLHAKTSKPIRAYTILPTTGCNARCYYCFEQGVKSITMSKQTADNVVDYIAKHHGGKDIHINWFGGEPTLGANRIDQICKGLNQRKINFQSSMVSNGYLFDEVMVSKAKQLWNLYHVQISVDGTEKNNNYIKDYVNAKDNPYQKVLKNVGLFLEQGIRVSVRMNFDIGNADDFQDLVDELVERYNDFKGLDIYATPVLGQHAGKDGNILHGDDDWMEKKIVELNDFARKAGKARSNRLLPCMEFVGCSAEDDSYMLIGADGSLARCLEYFEKEHIVGNVVDGITNAPLLKSWKQIADYSKCVDCIYFPKCVKMVNCPGGDRCYHLDRNLQIEMSVWEYFDDFCAKEGVNYGFQKA